MKTVLRFERTFDTCDSRDRKITVTPAFVCFWCCSCCCWFGWIASLFLQSKMTVLRIIGVNTEQPTYLLSFLYMFKSVTTIFFFVQNRKALQRWCSPTTQRTPLLKPILSNTSTEGQGAYYFSTTWTRNKSTRQDGKLLKLQTEM